MSVFPLAVVLFRFSAVLGTASDGTKALVGSCRRRCVSPVPSPTRSTSAPLGCSSAACSSVSQTPLWLRGSSRSSPFSRVWVGPNTDPAWRYFFERPSHLHHTGLTFWLQRRCHVVCHQRRSQLPEADGEQVGARGGVEVQAQRRVSDCQCQGGPTAVFPDGKTHLTEWVAVTTKITWNGQENTWSFMLYIRIDNVAGMPKTVGVVPHRKWFLTFQLWTQIELSLWYWKVVIMHEVALGRLYIH